MKTDIKNTLQPSYKTLNKNTRKSTPLYKYKRILKRYWDDFDRVLYEYENDIMLDSDIDLRTIQLIRNLKKIEQWKSNLFILYLHFQRLTTLAEALQIKQSSLSVYISKIKQEIKC